MRHRLLHLSDEHTDKFPAEAETVLGFVAERAVAEHVSLIASGGDWYDGPTNPEDRRRGVAMMDGLANAAPVCAVAGNHGAPRDLLTLVSRATKYPVHFALEPEVIRFRQHVTPQFLPLGAPSASVPSTDLLICCLPWLRKIDLAMAADARAVRKGGDVGALAMRQFRLILERFYEAIAAHPGPSIVLAHADVVRAWESKGNPTVGKEIVIPVGWLADLGADAVLLGHEHGRQEVAPGCWYSGAPRRIAHGEDEPKGIQLVDVVKGQLPAVQFIETPCAQMSTIEATWTPGGLAMAAGRAKAGDRVKLRYVVPEEQAVAARAAAEEQRRLYAEAGIEVQLDEVMKAQHRSRGGDAVARETSTWGKGLLFWEAKRKEVPETRHGRLQAWLAQAERATGVATALARARSAAVRYGLVKLRGLGPFATEQVIDFDALPGPLVALTGRKGEGKTTLLSALFALQHHRTPDNTWKLPDRATRDAYIDGTLTAGDGWSGRHRIEVDGKARAIDAYAWDANGVAVDGTKRGGTTGFDAHVAAHFADSALSLAGPFAAQFGAEDPIEAGPTARKNQLVTALGLDPLQTMAEWFEAQVAPPKKNGAGKPGLRAIVEELQRRLVGEQKQAEGQAEADQALAAARGAVTHAQEAVDGAVAAEEQARAALAEHERKLAAIKERGTEVRGRETAAREALTRAQRHVAEVQERHRKAVARVEELQRELADAERASEAAGQLGALEQALAEAVAAEQRTKLAFDQADAAHRAAREAEQQALAHLTVAKGAASTAGQGLAAARARLAEAERAAAGLAEAEREAAQLSAAEASLARAKDQLHQLEEAIRASAQWDADHTRRLADVDRRIADAKARVDKGSAAKPELEKAERAAEEVAILDVQIEGARDRAAEIEQRIAAVEAWATGLEQRKTDAHAAGKAIADSVERDERAVAQAPSVPCGGPSAFPACQFLRDAAEAEARLPSLHERLTAARAAYKALVDEGKDPARDPDNFAQAARRAAARKEEQEAIARLEAKRRPLAELAATAEDRRVRVREAEAAEKERAQLEEQRTVVAAEVPLASYLNQDARATSDASAAVREAEAKERAAREAKTSLAHLQRAAAQADTARAAVRAAEEQHARAVAAASDAEGKHSHAQQATAAARRAAEEAGRTSTAAATARAAAEKARNAARQAVETAAALDRARRELAEAMAAAEQERIAVETATEEEHAAERAVPVASSEVTAILAEYEAAKEAPPAGPDTAATETARRTLSEAEAAVAVRRARVEQLEEAARKVDTTEQELAEANERLEDATLWAETLGRNGIQAMEIDACKDAISEVVNDLLREAEGNRFTFRLETQTEKRTATAAEKREGVALVEGLALEIHDSTLAPGDDGKPRWQDAKTLSGGQRAIVGAAYRIAQVLYTIRQAGADPRVTVCFDEYGKGLDAESAREFVIALRKVVVKAGFDKLIFILHSESAHELADTRLVVRGGRVLVEGREPEAMPAELQLQEVA